jgi:WbqC-like protein family
MRAVIIQPHFLPFVGYFDLMNRADIFVYYDTAQFVRRSWHCRTYISEQSEAHWLSAPVRTAEGSRRPLREMKWADDQPWRVKMQRRLSKLYANTEESHVLSAIIDLVTNGPEALVDWNIAANKLIAAALDIGTSTLKASELGTIAGDKQFRIIQLCRELGATTYVCGPGSRSYIKERNFSESGIAVEWVGYDYEVRATTARGIEIFPSAIDLILRSGVSAAKGEFWRRSD